MVIVERDVKAKLRDETEALGVGRHSFNLGVPSREEHGISAAGLKSPELQRAFRNRTIDVNLGAAAGRSARAGRSRTPAREMCFALSQVKSIGTALRRPQR
jgi:hypothetical protein